MKQAMCPDGPERASVPSADPGRKIDLREAYSIYYRRRWLALFIIVLTLIGVVVGNYLQYPTFTSAVKILVERTAGPEIPFSREPIAFRKSEITETQCQLLVSEPVLAEVVRRLKLDERPEPSGSLRDRVHAGWRWVTGLYGRTREDAKRWVVERMLHKTYAPPKPPDRFLQAVGDLAAQVVAESVPSTDVILLTVRDHEPAMAARIADAVASIYLTREVEHQRSKAREVYDLINGQIESFKPRYDGAEAAVEAFEKQHQARLLKDRIRTQLEEISALEIAYRGTIEDRRTKVLNLRQDLARLEKTYSPDHPQVVGMRAELARAEEALESKSQTQPAVDAAARAWQAGAMLNRIREARQELEQLTSLEGEYDRLIKVRDREEKLYSELRTKREEALMAEAARVAGPRIFEDAVAAAQPGSPRKRLNLLLGLLGGILAAGAVCALREFLDRSVRTPEAVASAGVPCVWSIPDRRRPGALPGGLFASRGLMRNGLIGDIRSDAPLVRSYVSLFEELFLRVEGGAAPIILVTGASRGDGCTTVAANLALCAASLGARRTLLVDADLEGAGASALFGATKPLGLADVLMGKASADDIARPVNPSGLTLLPAGHGPGSLLVTQSRRFIEQLQAWRTRFDWIVVDAPPLLSSRGAVALGANVSGALLVLRTGRTRPEVLQRAVDELRSASVPILGAVMNRRRFVIPQGTYRRL